MTKTTSTPVPRSQQKAARREQLLDTAATMLVEQGLARFTMDALAAAAGVSKALPYRHFNNVTAVIGALYERELGHVGAAIDEATRVMTTGEQMLAAATAAYFAAVDERGRVLAQLAGGGSQIPAMLFGEFPPAPGFIVRLIERGFGCDPVTANVLASIAVSVAVAASDSVARGDRSRADMEAMATRAVIAAVTAALSEPSVVGQRKDE
jgi:AcrR family transcriptional regulator